ncbi:MAG: peptidylprolyl isomerase [bacterium]|nr:peptidylprolyl isomerase [bacterium]
MSETPASPKDGPNARTPWLLLAGAAVGLALASLGLLEERTDPGRLPIEAAAVVGDRTIRRVDYQRVLAGVAGDLRSPVDEAMRRRVLDRMIDEELLVQRALELGLAVIDRRVRGELTAGLIDSIVAEVDGETPSARDVERHYEENRDFFTRPGRLRALTLYFSTRRGEDDPRGTALERAAAARTRLVAGDSADEVEADLADRQVSPVPDTLLPASKIRDYVGPSVLEALLALETGAWSEPIEAGGGVHLAKAVDREPSVAPPLAEIEDLVLQDLQRRRGDEALRTYLDDLKARTPILIDEAVFADPSPAG